MDELDERDKLLIRIKKMMGVQPCACGCCGTSCDGDIQEIDEPVADLNGSSSPTEDRTDRS